MNMTRRFSGIGLIFIVATARTEVQPSKFEPLSSQDGVVIEISRGSAQPVPEIRGSIELATPPEQIARVLTNYARYGEIFSECLAKAEVLETGPKSTRLHLVWNYPLFFQNRDSIAAYSLRKLAGSSYILSWSKHEKPKDPQEGVRLQYVGGSVEVRPVGKSSSQVIYTFLGDLGGDFSDGVKAAAWKRQPIHYLRGLSKELGLPFPPSESKGTEAGR